MRAAMHPRFSLRRGLVGYWTLDEAADAASRSNLRPANGPFDMAVIGSVGSAAGPSNNLPLSRSFGGGANYLSTPDNAAFVFLPRSFSVAGWIYMTSKAATRPLIAHNQATGNDRSWAVDYNSGADRFRFIVDQTGANSNVSNATDSALGSPSLNTWYFLLARFDASSMKARIRVNMLAEAEGNTITAIHNSAETLRIGHDGGTGLVGRASHVGLWNRYITDREAHWLYNRGDGRDLVRGA